MAIFAFGLERVGLICTRMPRFSLALLLLVSTATLFGLTQITFDDELRLTFSSDAESYQTYKRFSSKFSSVENQFALLIESDKPMGKPELETIRNLHLDLQFIKGITGVISMFSARNPPNADGVARPILPAELPTGDQLTNLLQHVRSHPLVGGRLLSKDASSAIAIITFKKNNNDFAGLSALIKGINQLVRPAVKASGLQMSLTGEPALRYEILGTIRRDFHILNGLGAIFAISICFLFFRQPRLVFITSLPPMIGVMWTLGGFGLLQQPITAINNVLPTLVLVIGFSDALHMMQAIRRKMAQGETAKQAARTAVIEVGPACAMTSLTTMIACLSLTLSSSHAVIEFGIAACIAIFAAYLAIIMLIPTLAILLLPGMENDQKALAENKMSRLVASFCVGTWAFVQRRYFLITAISLPLLLVTGGLYFMIQTNYDFREYLSATSPANLAIDRINAKLGGADVVHILIESTAEVRQKADSLKVIRAVQGIMLSQDGFQDAFSLASVKDWAGTKDMSDTEFIKTIPGQYRQRLISPSRNEWLVSAYFPSTPAPQTRERINRLDAKIAPLRQLYPGYKITPTGISLLSAFASEQLIDGLKKSLLLAVIITMGIIAIAVGSLVLPLLSAVPNLLALTMVAAVLYLSGGGFQITSVLALTIAFGIAVDNSIHLLNRFRLERRQLGVTESLQATIEKTGPVLIVATLVLSGGLMVTQLSDLPMVQLFGQLCIVVLCTALVAGLIVLPALMLAASKRFDIS